MAPRTSSRNSCARTAATNSAGSTSARMVASSSVGAGRSSEEGAAAAADALVPRAPRGGAGARARPGAVVDRLLGRGRRYPESRRRRTRSPGL